jgi:hypothetical protein
VAREEETVTTKTCGWCGQEIRWFLTAAGKRMPADAKPEKRLILVGETDGMSMCQVVDTWLPHWASCKADVTSMPFDTVPATE